MNMLASLPALPALLMDQPVAVLLLKITCVLAIGWTGHLLLRRGNPRHRMQWWRGVACVCVAIVALSVLPGGLSLPVATNQPASVAIRDTTNPAPLQTPVVEASQPVRSRQQAQSNEQPKRTALPPAGRVRTAVEARKPMRPQPAVVQNSAETSRPELRIDSVASSLPTGIADVETQRIENANTSETFSWPVFLCVIWLAGVGFLSARWMFGYLLMGRLLQQAMAVPEEIREELQQLKANANCHSDISLGMHTDVPAPLVCGLRKPTILLPQWMCGEGSRDDWRGVLAHELSHIRTRDLWWQAVLHVIGVAMWWHPFAWRIRRAHALACEFKADFDSASIVGETMSYLRTLARVALAVRSPVPGTGLAMAGRSEITQRVQRLKSATSGFPSRKRTVIIVAVLACCFAGLLGTMRFVAAELPAEEGTSSQQSTAKPNAAPKPQPAPSRQLLVTIVDEAGKPLPNASLVVRIGNVGDNNRKTYTTDANGRITATLPKNPPGLLVLTAKAAKHVRMQATWYHREGQLSKPIPETITFRMEKGTTIGGRIVDESGKPIAGAEIVISASGRKATETDPTRQSVYGEMATTDAEGNWRCHVVPAKPTRISLKVKHPKFVSATHYRSVNGGKVPKLRDFSHELVMERGITVEGYVRGPDGKPVEGAYLALGNSPFGGDHLYPKTDKNGYYRFRNIKKDSTVITVVAKGLAPELRRIDVTDDLESVDFDLKQGKTIRLRVVNKAGEPVQARIIPDTWRGNRSLMGLYDKAIPHRTDKTGQWVWKGAPADAILFDILPSGYGAVRNKSLKANDEEEYSVTVPPLLKLSGRVFDAKTKKPISSFRVVEGTQFSTSRDIHWMNYRTWNGRDGKYALVEGESVQADHKRFYRVEAKGYLPAVSRAVGDEGTISIDFALKKSSRPLPAGVVMTRSGVACRGAKIYLCTPSNGAYVRNGAIPDRDRTKHTTTDDSGRFKFEPQVDKYALLVVAEEGFAQVEQIDVERGGKIVVEPWARIEGTMMIGGKPGANLKIGLNFNQHGYKPGEPHIYYDYDAKTDAEGRFVFTKVPPGMSGTVSRQIVIRRDAGFTTVGHTHSVPFAVESGKTLKVTLGGTGRPLIARLALPKGMDRRVEWNVGHQWLRVDPRPMAVPGMPAPHSPSYSFHINADGTFRVEDLPPGNYRLTISVHERALRDGRVPEQGKLIGSIDKSFTVGPIAGGRTDKPLDLGTLELKMAK